jgi:hypothetical protein
VTPGASVGHYPAADYSRNESRIGMRRRRAPVPGSPDASER